MNNDDSCLAISDDDKCIIDIAEAEGLKLNTYLQTTHFFFVSPNEHTIYYANKYLINKLPFTYSFHKEDGKIKSIGKLINKKHFKETYYNKNLNDDFMFCWNDSMKGEHGAIIVKQLLQKEGYQIETVTDYERQTQGVDLIAIKENQLLKIEVKTDFKTATTENVYYEIYRPMRKGEI